ncbi:SDR family NAD(P)-dependent oxidoreductase [Paucisalibacillus sp. EB02]|uniref:SDR family NAD(P)-dependent oxidoreductase n=1 Tax=Paucisalibacillus sp. EB02 TaxID=1347087 RepID=UPI0004B794C7|nr:SDR family NAD(P)-dependent oxidoreductase [Paucisalibacillus sp. EB02]
MVKTNALMEKVLFPRTFINKNKLYNELTGKTILITGASSGIGEQLVYYLGDINCHLILVARRKDKLLDIRNIIKAAEVSIFAADLRDEYDRNEFLVFINKLDHIDYFVNNAGISIKRSIYDSLDRFHDFKRSMAINYFAPVEILLSIIPLLEKNKGQIINVSTINTLLIPFPNFSAYQASKQALDTWFQSVSPELNVKGIFTTSIYLPLVRTPMIEPTTGYQRMPAMSSEHVAIIISKSMYTKRTRFKPWWIIGGQVASLLFRGLWGKIGKSFMKKRGSR